MQEHFENYIQQNILFRVFSFKENHNGLDVALQFHKNSSSIHCAAGFLLKFMV